MAKNFQWLRDATDYVSYFDCNSDSIILWRFQVNSTIRKKHRMDGPQTDRWTDGWTNWRTDPHIEMRKRIEKCFFKPNLHKTDKSYTYNGKSYFIWFARRFYPNLIKKQVKFWLFLQILCLQKIFCFQRKYYIMSQYLSILKSVKQSKLNSSIYQIRVESNEIVFNVVASCKIGLKFHFYD